MEGEEVTVAVKSIMIEFADQTGLSLEKNPARRYLWTDAFAVCNFLSLYRQTGSDEYRRLAIELVDQVHDVLGKHRERDARCGWISGLSDEDGRKHPTAGGLRIGKILNERRPDDPYDERLEWNRDGQYFHYLTKWMHALCRVSAVTDDSRYCHWAAELAKVAHAGFTVASPTDARKRLFWKMSIDLTRPLVPSTGLHDPLDAYITYNEIDGCAARFSNESGTQSLSAEVSETAAMIEGQHWHTDDLLGLGGLLFDASRAIQLTVTGQMENAELAIALVRTANESLASCAANMPFNHPGEYRLAFRELGLAIGLRAVRKMQENAGRNPELFGNRLLQRLEEMRKYVPLVEVIEDFWCLPANQAERSWLDHLDISKVMLATSLLPDEFLAV